MYTVYTVHSAASFLTTMAASQDNTPIVKSLKEGFLEKRQRGRHIKSERQRKRLKFQKRFCVLTKEALMYSKEKVSQSHARPGSMHVL